MITFSNPGTLDPRLITTLGVNVKDSANGSPFGHFGTGLKYAIAVLLREKQRVTLFTDGKRISFAVEPTEIRGKLFEFIMMRTEGDGAPQIQELGFTTELGKNWGLEHAYRELHCNCKDEGGSGGVDFPFEAEQFVNSRGVVSILVAGEEFHQVHLNRDKFLLSPGRTLVAALPDFEIYAGKSSHYFYKGVAVCKLPQPSQFLYNFTRHMALTEDRTLAQAYMADHYVEETLVGNPLVPEYVLEALTAKGSHEQEALNFNYKTFHAEVKPRIARLIETNMTGLNKSLLGRYSETAGADDGIKFVDYEPEAEQSAKLGKAIEFCTSIGYPVADYEIRTVVSLGDRILALASMHKNEILLSRKAMVEMDMPELSSTLIEEFVHLRFGLGDHTRQMQDKLFGEIVRLGQALRAVGATAQADDIPF